jgi:threonine aldolase
MNESHSTHRVIDLRSDTITRPTDAMRQAMASAEVGDDVWGDDPTINRLESVTAERLGHEAAVFCPSGTQANLIALLTHCARGDEYIVGDDAHTYKWEGGGAAVLGGIQPQTVPFGENGLLPLESVAKVIKPDDAHYARTRLVCLENTQHGRVQSLQSMQEARRFVDEQGLLLHLDGARAANAAVALGVSLLDIGSCFHSVSLCLSKGLGAPVGSVLVGSSAFIKEARRWRKVTGGGMRQAGVLAAAALLALDEGFDRLHEDHANAVSLARMLAGIDGLKVRDEWTQTNMVWLDLDNDTGEALSGFAREQGVLLAASGYGARLVLHRDVAVDDLDRVVEVIARFYAHYFAH